MGGMLFFFFPLTQVTAYSCYGTVSWRYLGVPYLFGRKLGGSDPSNLQLPDSWDNEALGLDTLQVQENGSDRFLIFYGRHQSSQL